MKPTRIFIVLIFLGFGLWQGGLTGMFYMFLIFGMVAFCWYAFTDFMAMIFGTLSRPREYNVTVHDGEARKGHPDVQGSARHSDPTRPTTDDYMGLITYRLK